MDFIKNGLLTLLKDNIDEFEMVLPIKKHTALKDSENLKELAINLPFQDKDVSRSVSFIFSISTKKEIFKNISINVCVIESVYYRDELKTYLENAYNINDKNLYNFILENGIETKKEE